ncbi:Beta-1,3-galactosyltransferase 6-like [Oopsacas minuta]|uniref:Hexosyltransferase n=1 Tax=Oopsacas minuta TaxID=111878 RepID=A0AAV7JHV7_9METZ|nr:Beta-1,3-galactosyltransferase 6-like [Oopsacas minuta]
MSALLEEKDKFGDIVILDGVEEEFSKLTRKVLKAFTWASEHIDSVYYFKADDDCYIVIDNVYKTITDRNFRTEKLIFGHKMVGSAVLPKGRWAELGWFLCPRVYLPYPSGMAYILTKDVVKFLNINSDRLMIYNNEDASLGSWVAGLKLTFVNDPRVIISAHSCLPSVWAIHGYGHKRFAEIHSSLLSGTIHCP